MINLDIQKKLADIYVLEKATNIIEQPVFVWDNVMVVILLKQ